MSEAIDFRFIEYNPRRASRGAEAVRMEVILAGEVGWLWMRKSDIRKNMKEFGPHPELVKGLEAYNGVAAVTA